MWNIYAEVSAAEERIRPHVLETPLISAPELSAQSGATLFLKLENRQHTGSFKLRGATNKILSLSAEERRRGIVTASTGNHGLAVAHAASRLDTPATIYLPESASAQKVAKLRTFAVELRFVPGDAVNAEVTARRVSEEEGKPFVSPYNDPQVAGGQGTIGVELLRRQPDLEAIFISVGGGGLIAGIAGYIKAVKPNVEIVGCLPANSPVMLESVRAGHIVEMETLPTLSDGTAGGIEPDAITFEACQRLVDRWLLVSEEEIAAAVRLIHAQHGEIVEGAAGVAVASLLQDPSHWHGKAVAAVLCGGNIDPVTFQTLIA
jgi:threonine dehydratase